MLNLEVLQVNELGAIALGQGFSQGQFLLTGGKRKRK
jgi:hypothetical protein